VVAEKLLVTTADERTWPKELGEQVLFLGAWCQKYDRRAVWSKLHADVIPYHWNNRGKLKNDYKYLDEVYERFLRILADTLNQFHGTNFSLNYWRILVGPWLGYFIQILFDRWYMLKKSVDEYGITKCNILATRDACFVPNDMKDFIVKITKDDWNEHIYAEILSCFYNDKVALNIIDLSFVNKEKKERIDEGIKLNFRNKIIQYLSRMISSMLGGERYFIINSYMSYWSEFYLNIFLGQVPRVRSRIALPRYKVRKEVRGELNVSGDGGCFSFEGVVRKMLFDHIPMAYLEGYKELVSEGYQYQWPKKPRLIFTSNAYLSDDMFKAWAAEQVDSGVPLLIGQHGGHYRMTPFAFEEEHQIKISNRWLSWGVKGRGITPIGNIKSFGRQSVKYNKNGGALLVEMATSRYSGYLFASPLSSQWVDYFEDQVRFVSALPKVLRDQLSVRLYMQDYDWCQSLRWKDRFSDVVIDSGRSNIYKAMRKTRLYVATYNATTYLESLTWNIPTIMFWNPEHWELNEEAVPYFNLLESVGIFHRSPEGAAQMMCKVWDDIDGWWKSEKVQNARIAFCNQYARSNDDYMKDLVGIVREMAAKKG